MYNKLLPRLVPQPANIGGMSERRFEKREELCSWLDDLHGEAKFERNLCVHKNDSQKMESVWDALKEWCTYISPSIYLHAVSDRS